ncbi:winged helix DNA-binding protein [Sphingomonas crocodyli]|uniref:MarR family transcriptional regulator n=1 Tax=Sphingomonas crocodyli TaxID=1979270 RepID=A0A437M6M7_9SPHN|nr:winged helix DNA-binding protein [Sphingomonas crocodyli]RVT93368.1 MarR family transcriptional regulator [Sphingomonas crocodyli]
MADWDDSPTVLIFGDSDAGIAAATRSATHAGARVAAALPIAAAIDRLNIQVSTDLVVVDVTADHGDALDRLLDRLDAEAEMGHHASVVTVAPALIDLAAARIKQPGVALLATPQPAERALAVAEMLARPRTVLHDVKSDGGQARLQKLSEEVGRIARTLARLSDEVQPTGVRERASPPPIPAEDGATIEPADAPAIRAMIRARRLRDQFFGNELFADPAWDMLLDLTASRIEQRPVAVSSLCIASAVPATTALRWIRQLTDAGLFKRIADPLDGRRVFIELTDRAAQGMRGYLTAAARLGTVVV